MSSVIHMSCFSIAIVLYLLCTFTVLRWIKLLNTAVNFLAVLLQFHFHCLLLLSVMWASTAHTERERERQAGGRVRDKARFACWAATALLCVVSWPSVRSGPVRCGWVARSAADGVRSTATLISLRPRRDPNNVTKMHASSSLTS